MAFAKTILWVCLVIVYKIVQSHNASLSQWDFGDADIPKLVVELGVVCDKDFSKLFNYDEEKITKVMVDQIRSVSVAFQTLRRTQISILLTTIQVIKNASDQPFIETSLHANGSINLLQVAKEFSTWLYHTSVANVSDVVLLVTETIGEDLSSHFPDSACSINDSQRAFESAFVVQSSVEHWFSDLSISLPLAGLLGAKHDTNTTCNDKNGLMNSTADYLFSYYFSDCSDLTISTFVQSVEASCLYKRKSYKNTNRLSNLWSVPSSGDEICHLLEDKYGNNFSKVSKDCFRTPCAVQKSGYVYTTYNTPCSDDEKTCFRGRCLPIGKTLRNVGSGGCLLSGYMPSLHAPLSLYQCPKYSFRFDQVHLQLRNNTGSEFGYFIVATDNDINNTKKCLTVLSDKTTIVFSKCPQVSDHAVEFIWDLPKAKSQHVEFELFHRETKKFAQSNERMDFFLREDSDSQSRFHKWTFGASGDIMASVVENSTERVDSIEQPSNQYNRVQTMQIKNPLLLLVASFIAFLGNHNF